VTQLLRVRDDVDGRDAPVVGDAECHHPPQLPVRVAPSEARKSVHGRQRFGSGGGLGQHGHEEAGGAISAEHGSSGGGDAPATVGADDHVRGEKAQQVLDVFARASGLEGFRDRRASGAIFLEAEPADLHRIACAGHEVTAGDLAASEGAGELVVPDAEHVPHHEGDPLRRRQRLE
jgi:hypothetical protein